LIGVEAIVAIVFYVLSALAIAGALGVVLARSIFHSAMFLVATLGSVAGVFVLLGADFLAAVQILIYVGAIMVLILFGIMLTPQREAAPEVDAPGKLIGGIIAALAVFGVSATVIVSSRWPGTREPGIELPTTQTIGVGLFTTYVLPFEVASVLLLVAMIGAIILAREE